MLFLFLLIVNYFNLNYIITNYILLITSFALFIGFGFCWCFLNYWFHTFNLISCSFTSLIGTRSGGPIHIAEFKVMINRLSMPGYPSLSFLIQCFLLAFKEFCFNWISGIHITINIIYGDFLLFINAFAVFVLIFQLPNWLKTLSIVILFIIVCLVVMLWSIIIWHRV